MTRREVEELVVEIDRDKTGDIGWAEFLEIMTLTLKQRAEEGETGGDKSYQVGLGQRAGGKQNERGQRREENAHGENMVWPL